MTRDVRKEVRCKKEDVRCKKVEAPFVLSPFTLNFCRKANPKPDLGGRIQERGG